MMQKLKRPASIGASIRAFALWIVPVLFFACAGSFDQAHAQVLYGTMTGNVTDTSGGAVPHATVKATNAATGVVRETESNAEGIYLFTDLIPGTYTMDVTATGFSPYEVGGINLLPNTTVRENAFIKVGSVTEQVTVTTAPPVLQTESAQTDANLSTEQIALLPTTSSTGRNFQSLYKVIPGATPPAEAGSAAGNPQRAQVVNVNGISNNTNTTRIDGAIDAYPWQPAYVAYLPPTDGIESVNVVTGSFNAEQGAAGGSAINVTVKSGTNQFHGSTWEYNSIAQFNAQSWQNRTGVRQKNIYNEVGGVFGGPILRNKLFFFGDYNRVSVNKAINGTFSLPTGDMRAGRFAATGITIYDPTTGDANGNGKTAFAGNQIPDARIAPAARKLLSLLPPTNTGAVGALVNNYFGSGVNAFVRQGADVKVTYVPTQKTSYFGHYSISPNNINDPQVFGTNPGGTTFDGGQPGVSSGRIQNVGIGTTHAFTSNLLVDANFGFTRQYLSSMSGDLALGDYGSSSSGLNIPGTNYNGQSLYGGIPYFAFTTYASLGNASPANPFLFRDNQYTGNVNASWIHGKHSFRFGSEYLHTAINHLQAGSGSYASPRGTFVFGGGVTAPAGGSLTNVNSFADFLLGQSTNYQKGVQIFNPEALRLSTFGFFAQDTWQLTKDLTLNYGARYEYYPLPISDHFGTIYYDPALRSSVTDTYGTHQVGTVVIGGRGGNPQHAGIDNHWGMFVPRFGLSYRANPKTVVRAGFGMTVDPDSLRGMLQAYPAAPTLSVTGVNSYVAATSINAGLQTTANQVGIPAIPLPDITSGFVPLPANVSTYHMAKDFRRGYIYSYNLAVQRELPYQFTATVAYVGTQSIRQQTSVNINPAAPGGGNTGRLLNTTYGANTSNSDINEIMPFHGTNYNGLQTQLTRTSDKHGATGIVYTFSKAMDASDNGYGGGLTFSYPTVWNRDWALAGYDRKHNFQWWSTYVLPFGKGQSYLASGPAGYVIGGWSLSTILSRVSGTPMTISASSGLLNAPGNSQVADVVAGVNPILGTNTNGARQYLNPAAFKDVSTATGVTTPRFGTSGRDAVRGPGLFNLDASLKRSFPIRESLKLELAAEAFDVTNTPQFANPAANISASGFGTITSSNVNRTMRLSGRITF